MPKSPSAEPSATDTLAHVDTWIFDLDNTLYPGRCNLFAQVDRRMGQFISTTLGLDPDAARALQKRYFREYGTTLSGLMQVDGIEPKDFLDFVHDIDLSPIDPDPTLQRALADLGGRKLVYTNGSVSHAERVLDRLGISSQFEAIIDIVAAGYVPKPDPTPYAKLVAEHAIAPDGTAMVEDIARNLVPARDLGMTTVWLRGEHDWAAPPPDADYVDHVIDDLPAWLAAIVAARRSASQSG